MAVKKDIFLEVVSAERTLASCKVDSVELPGTLGRFEVLPDHAPLLRNCLYRRRQDRPNSCPRRLRGSCR